MLLLLSHFSCVRLCDPIDGSPPGSAIPGILQARTREWVAISSSSAWKWKVKVKSLSCAQLLATPWSVAYQAPPSMGFSRQEYWKWVAIAFSDSIVNKAGMISDLYFSHHNLEVLCYCYKYIECWSDYVPGRADKKRILEQRHAGQCMVVVVVQ